MSKALATKNVAAVLLGVALVFGFAFAFAKPAKADTVSDLQAQIQSLLAQISKLQGSSSTTSAGASCSFTFTLTLKVGSKGSEVMQLQKFLNMSSDTQVAATGAGSPGNETSVFGPATKKAVIKFQEKYAADILTPVGLSKGTGLWGVSTRAKANAVCTTSGTTGGTTGATTGGTTAGGNLTVAAGTQPANSLAPQGAARVPFTTFVLTNTSSQPITVNGVTVQRTGLMQDAVFSGIVLIDQNNIQIGTSKTLNSNHQATVGDTFTINPGQSMTLTVAGNMASSLASYAGQVGGLSVVGVNTTATVSGALPINGAQQTVNATLSIGSVSTTTSAFDPGTAQTKNIGDTGVKFSGVKFTAGSTEDLKLYSIRWRQVGSVSSSDLANVVTIVNGTSYPTTVDSTGKYYTTVFPGGLLIAKGNSIDVYIQGDIVGSNSASRTVDFDIDKVTDVYFVGQLYGYGIAPSGTYTPWYNGNVATINGASVTTISKDNTAGNASQNIAINVPNQPLGGYIVDLKGEAMTVQSEVFTVATGTASTGLLQSVSIVDENGKVVAGPVDATWVSGTQTLTFTDSVTYPTGRHMFSLKGKVPTGATNGATIAISSTPSSNWTNVTGAKTGNSISLSGIGAFTMNTMTVKAGALAVTIGTTPVAQTVIAGTTGLTFANVQLDASQSGEDIRLSSLALTETDTGTFGGAANKLSACQLYNATSSITTGSNTVNPSATATSTAVTATFTFDNSLVVPKGTVVTLALKCNLSATSDANSTFQWGITGTQIAAISVTGVTSGATITATGSTNSGQVMTAASSGTLTATAASSATPQPALALVPAGTAGVTSGSVKFHSSNEDISVQKIGLTLASGTYGSKSTGAGGSSNSGAGDVVTAYIYNSQTLIGTATFTGSNQTATSTLTNPITVPANTDLVLTVKADLAAIGTNLSGGIGDTVKVDPLNAQGVGLSSGTQVNISATAGVNGIQMFKSVPTIANLGTTCTSGNSCNGTSQLLKSFTVTANAAGSVSVGQFKVSFATSSASVTNVKVQVLDQNNNVATSTFGAQASTVGATNIVTFTGGPLIVPAGATYTFKVYGDITTSATPWSVNVTLKGDSAALAVLTSGYNMATSSAATGDTNSSFIWSDNATTTAGVNDVDWTNGYQVNGLPSTGF